MTNTDTRIPWLRLLVEGTAIILSILLALALDEWRDAARDRDLEREYLQRLLADLDANLAVASRQHRDQTAQIAAARSVYPLVSEAKWTGEDTASVVVASYRATPSPTPSWVDDTFEELKSTGRMTLIRNPSIRAELLAYYRFLGAADYTYELMSTSYRDAVRARMHPDLQLHIRSECRGPAGRCLVEADRRDLADYVRWLSGNEELADGLRRVIVQWTRGEEEYLPGVEERTHALSALIEEELSG